MDPKGVDGQDQIAGYYDVKRHVRDVITHHLLHRVMARKRGRRSGILLHGPPGTGKTTLAMLVAATFPTVTVYSATSSDIMDRYTGMSERNVRGLFVVAASTTPSMIIFDDMEEMFGTRREDTAEGGDAERVKIELLAMMTLYKDVIVMGITNLPWMVDRALLRRFQARIHVGLPDEKTRRAVLKLRLDVPTKGVDLDALVKSSDGMTGDAIEQAVTEADQDDIGEILAKATHFRALTWKGETKYIPYDASDQGAKKRAIEDLPDDSLFLRVITGEALYKALQNQSQLTVNPKETDEKHLKWQTNPWTQGDL